MANSSLSWRNVALISFIVSVITSLSVIIYVSLSFHSTYDEKAAEWVLNQDKRDAIFVAVQLGRLDFVSLVLALLGVVVVLFGMLGFPYIRHRAENEARIAAEEAFEKKYKEWFAQASGDEVPTKEALPKSKNGFASEDAKVEGEKGSI